MNRFLGIAILFIIACGGSNESNTEKSKDGASFLQEGFERYDPNDIDPEAKVDSIQLRASGNSMTEMTYDKAVITVTEGTTIVLSLYNDSRDMAMQHNFVLIEEGTDSEVGLAAVKAGIDKDFVPDMPEVLVATSMLEPGDNETISFKCPKKGAYKFICTYPGHYSIMQGDFIVQ